MRDLFIKAQTGEPSISQVHPDVLDEPALTRDAYKYPINRMRSRTSGSIEGRPVWL